MKVVEKTPNGNAVYLSDMTEEEYGEWVDDYLGANKVIKEKIYDLDGKKQ